MNRRSFVKRALGGLVGLASLAFLPTLQAGPDGWIRIAPGKPRLIKAFRKKLRCDGILCLAAGSSIDRCELVCDDIHYAGSHSKIVSSIVTFPKPPAIHILGDEGVSDCEFSFNVIKFADSGLWDVSLIR